MSVSTCSFSWGGILVLGGMSLSLELPWDSGWSPWVGGEGVACTWQGDLDIYCLIFLSESVVWTRLGYFLEDGTTLHMRVEVRYMHHIEHEWLELWMDVDSLLSVYWTNECRCKLMIFFNVFLLIVVIWFLY